MITAKPHKKKSRLTWHIHTWVPIALRHYQTFVKKKRKDSPRSDWWAMGFSFESLKHKLQTFIQGDYQFSPLRQFYSAGETIRMWQYDDRIILRCFFHLLKPTFPHMISRLCYHLKGPQGVKLALRHIENALNARSFQYAIRLDIKAYYESISHPILLQQLESHYHDPKVRRYLNDIVKHAVDHHGDVFLPRQGIPRRSSFSPFFGAVYLSPLDRAFEQRTGCLYLRFMDDVLVLFETQRQFQRGRKTLFQILRDLKLSPSPSKTWMGKLTRSFHFLGVTFCVTKPELQSHRLSISIHPRSCARALDQVKALNTYAGDPATSQRYLLNWGRWWASAVSPLSFVNLILAWIQHTRDRDPSLVWLGSGLLFFSWSRGNLCYV